MSFFTADRKPIWKPVLIGFLISVLITAILICLFALTVLMMPTVPYGMIDGIVIGIEGFGVLTGAYISCAIFKSKGLMIGLLIGCVALLSAFAIGLSVKDNSIGVLTIVRSAVLLLCGIGGGVAGVNRKDKVRIK